MMKSDGNLFKNLSSQKIGGLKGVPIDSPLLHTESLMFLGTLKNFLKSDTPA
jgi:hypothetical protein